MKVIIPIIFLILIVIEIIVHFIQLYIISKNKPENYEEQQGKILTYLLFIGCPLGFILGIIFDLF